LFFCAKTDDTPLEGVEGGNASHNHDSEPTIIDCDGIAKLIIALIGLEGDRKQAIPSVSSFQFESRFSQIALELLDRDAGLSNDVFERWLGNVLIMHGYGDALP